VRNNGPWGTFYRLGEAVEGTGGVGSPMSVTKPKRGEGS
jgi:hypothetical protein